MRRRGAVVQRWVGTRCAARNGKAVIMRHCPGKAGPDMYETGHGPLLRTSTPRIRVPDQRRERSCNGLGPRATRAYTISTRCKPPGLISCAAWGFSTHTCELQLLPAWHRPLPWPPSPVLCTPSLPHLQRTRAPSCSRPGSRPLTSASSSGTRCRWTTWRRCWRTRRRCTRRCVCRVIHPHGALSRHRKACRDRGFADMPAALGCDMI